MTGRATGKAASEGAGKLLAPGGSEQHDHYLPFRRVDLLAALLQDPRIVSVADRSLFLRFNRLLGAILHVESALKLERLKDHYHCVDPDYLMHADVCPEVFSTSYAAVMDQLTPLLRRANFIEVGAEELDRAHKESAGLNLKVNAPAEDLHAVRFFRRGRGLDSFEVKDWFRLRPRQVEVEVYSQVVMVAAMRTPDALNAEQRERMERARLQPGSVLIKTFRNIASADLNVLLPNLRVNMSLIDKLMMAVPAVVGGVPILFKLVSSLTVLFVVIGFYLGLRGAVRDEEMKTAIAAIGALVALGAFIIRQWVRYERQSLKYLKELSDKVFVRNMNQNAGFFDYLLGTIEDQDRKETLLAYAFLRTCSQPQDPFHLNSTIEEWIKVRMGLTLKFEIQDALDTLDRLGLLERSGDRYAAVSLQSAVSQLDRAWQRVVAVEEYVEPGES